MMGEQMTGRGQAAPEPFDPTITPRPAVAWFAQRMEMKLRANEHKGDWHNLSYAYLMHRLRGEARELVEAIKADKGGEASADAITNEAADVANFAMMIATIADACGS